jgi:hypothetical protein
MKNLAIIFTLMFSTACVAEDDCVRGEPKPIGMSEHSLVDTYKIILNNDGRLEEALKLKSGQIINISQYGCAHFGLEYKFKLEKEFKGNLVLQAKKYLELVGEFAPRFTLSLMKAMKKVPDDFPTPDLITLEPGYDWIYLSAKKENNEHFFIITYDIAL